MDAHADWVAYFAPRHYAAPFFHFNIVYQKPKKIIVLFATHFSGKTDFSIRCKIKREVHDRLLVVGDDAGTGTRPGDISVNTDASCPMMAMADLAIVSDAGAVLDALAARLGITQPAG